MLDWGEEALAPLESVRPIELASLHVTLAFLGELDARGAERAGAIVGALRPRPVRVRLAPAVVGVPRRRPRVLALGEVEGESEHLQAELSRALVGAELLEPEGRPFWPHLSVARVRRGALDGSRGRAILESVPPLAGRALEPHDAERVVLYRSELGPERAAYTALAETMLPAGGDG